MKSTPQGTVRITRHQDDRLQIMDVRRLNLLLQKPNQSLSHVPSVFKHLMLYRGYPRITPMYAFAGIFVSALLSCSSQPMGPPTPAATKKMG